MSATIRPIQAADKAVWQGLWQQYNDFYKRTIADKVTDKTFERFLDDRTRMYAAVAIDTSANDRLVGFCHWYPHPSTSSIEEVVYLHDLFVDPAVRNGGIGRKLVEHVYEYARELPAANVYWHTQFFNHAGQLLYTKVADRTDFVVYRKVL